jgi:hypothetical protein
MPHDTTSTSSARKEEMKISAARRKRAGASEVTSSRAPFAPTPRKLINDPRVCAEAVRLWGVLDELAFEGIAPEIPILRARMITERRNKDAQIERRVPGQASIYRWLNELETGGWLHWERNADLGDRFEILDGSPASEAKLQLQQVRTLMRQMQRAVTMDDQRALLAEMAQILTGENPSLTDENTILTSENPSLTDENTILTSENPSLAGENPNHIYRDSWETHETSSDTMPTHPPVVGDDVPTPTELFLQEENLGIARELREMPLDMAQRYVADSKQRGAALPAIAKGLRARWQRELSHRREQAAAAAPPDWLGDAVWPTLPDELRLALHGTTIDDEGYLCYDEHYEAAIIAHEATVKALLRQARREKAVGAVAG